MQSFQWETAAAARALFKQFLLILQFVALFVGVDVLFLLLIMQANVFLLSLFSALPKVSNFCV